MSKVDGYFSSKRMQWSLAVVFTGFFLGYIQAAPEFIPRSKVCSKAPMDFMYSCKALVDIDETARALYIKQKELQGDAFGGGGIESWKQAVPLSTQAFDKIAYHPYDCMTTTCLCLFFQGVSKNGSCILRNGQTLKMAYRKEYRMLTEDERERYHAALNELKRSGEYDTLNRIHKEVAWTSGVHAGRAFLPWHREYIKRVEIALRMIDPSLALPYWDWVMDNHLPQPADSVLFSNLFVGETDENGNVTEGPFAFWPTLEGRDSIERNVNQFELLISEHELANATTAHDDAINMLAFTGPIDSCTRAYDYRAFENVHAIVHSFVGGEMLWPNTSVNDPIFFNHHSFVDLVWETWRLEKQTREQREQEYPKDTEECTNWRHFATAAMRPLRYFANKDGLSNRYTDSLYGFAPRPNCSKETPDCGSPYLFCDARDDKPHCVSKVGVCRGFEELEVCFNSKCVNGSCIHIDDKHGVRDASESSRDVSEGNLNATSVERFVPAFVDCFDRHPCCGLWTENGKCAEHVEFMSQFCEAACNICKPAFHQTDTCEDRHVACAQFAEAGLCAGGIAVGDVVAFMTENCRASCNLCAKDRDAVCYHGNLLLPVPETPQLVKQIRYSFDQETELKIHALRPNSTSSSD